MREIFDDDNMPPWLLERVDEERRLFDGSGVPTSLGSPGYRVMDPTSRGEWLWDNGPGGALVFSADGSSCSMFEDLPDEEQDRISLEL